MIDPCIRVNPAAEDSFVYSVLPTLRATLRIIKKKKNLLFWRGSGNCDNLGEEEREWKKEENEEEKKGEETG